MALSAWLQSPRSSPLNLASVSQKCHMPGYWGPRNRTNACHLFLWHFPANIGKHLLSARHIRSTVVHTWNIKNILLGSRDFYLIHQTNNWTFDFLLSTIPLIEYSSLIIIHREDRASTFRESENYNTSLPPNRVNIIPSLGTEEEMFRYYRPSGASLG